MSLIPMNSMTMPYQVNDLPRTTWTTIIEWMTILPQMTPSKKINGEEGATRDDYSPNGDDNLLVTGVAGNKYSLGYFGYGYYEKSKEKLKLLKVSNTDDVADALAPSPEAIQSGDYKPLARPVFIYVNKKALARPTVKKFLDFYLGEGQNCVPVVGCVKMSADDLANSA